MFPPEFEKFALAELGAAGAAELLAALDGEAVTSVRYNPFKLAAMPASGADEQQRAEQYKANCKPDKHPYNQNRPLYFHIAASFLFHFSTDINAG